jgi:hypothetical protein
LCAWTCVCVCGISFVLNSLTHTYDRLLRFDPNQEQAIIYEPAVSCRVPHARHTMVFLSLFLNAHPHWDYGVGWKHSTGSPHPSVAHNHTAPIAVPCKASEPVSAQLNSYCRVLLQMPFAVLLATQSVDSIPMHRLVSCRHMVWSGLRSRHPAGQRTSSSSTQSICRHIRWRSRSLHEPCWGSVCLTSLPVWPPRCQLFGVSWSIGKIPAAAAAHVVTLRENSIEYRVGEYNAAGIVAKAAQPCACCAGMAGDLHEVMTRAACCLHWCRVGLPSTTDLRARSAPCTRRCFR